MNSMELNQLCQWADDLYQFVMVMMDHMKQPRDYGTGKILNMVEIHTLSMISESPGICISDVAKRWNRTLSAASRNIDRLAAKGYVEKKKTDGNGKTVHLYLTEKGQNLEICTERMILRKQRNLPGFLPGSTVWKTWGNGMRC